MGPGKISALTAAPAEKDSPKRNTLIGVGIVAAIVVVIAVMSFLGKPAYAKTAENYYKSIIEVDAKLLTSVFPKAYMEDREDYFSSRSEMMDAIENNLENDREYLEGICGDNLKVKCKLLLAEKLKSDDIEEIEERYEDDYGIFLNITEAKTLVLWVKFTGTEDDYSRSVTVNTLKIGGKWYLDVESLYTYAY